MVLLSSKVLVPGTISSAFLDSLIPDTPYSVVVSALYADTEGAPVKGNGKTRKNQSQDLGSGAPGLSFRLNSGSRGVLMRTRRSSKKLEEAERMRSAAWIINQSISQ